MRILCQKCGHAGDASNVRVEGTVVLVTCSACGDTQRIGAEPTAAAPAHGQDAVPATPLPPSPLSRSEGAEKPAADLPPVKCPKCGHRQHDTYACHTCGLVFSRVREGSRPWDRVPPGKESAVAAAAELWTAVEIVPDDEERHRAFAEHCRSNAIPDWGVMRYRHWLADHPGHEVATRYHQRMLGDAQALAQAFAKGESERFARAAGRFRTVLLGIVIVMALAATLVIMRMIAARPSMDF